MASYVFKFLVIYMKNIRARIPRSFKSDIKSNFLFSLFQEKRVFKSNLFWANTFAFRLGQIPVSCEDKVIKFPFKESK